MTNEKSNDIVTTWTVMGRENGYSLTIESTVSKEAAIRRFHDTWFSKYGPHLPVGQRMFAQTGPRSVDNSRLTVKKRRGISKAAKARIAAEKGAAEKAARFAALDPKPGQVYRSNGGYICIESVYKPATTDDRGAAHKWKEQRDGSLYSAVAEAEAAAERALYRRRPREARQHYLAAVALSTSMAMAGFFRLKAARCGSRKTKTSVGRERWFRRAA